MALSPSLGLTEHFIRSFENNWNHTVQQELSYLRDKVIVTPFTGKELVLTDLDQVEFTERSGRLTTSNPEEVTGKKRKIIKRDFKCQIILDKNDKDLLGTLGEPTSPILQEMKYAWNRAVDEKIVAAASATVYGGAEPYTTAIDLPSSQQVAVNYVPAGGTPANSGLTPEKIIRARKLFRDNHIDPKKEECFLALSPADEEFLATYIKASGNDVWANMLAKHEETGMLFGFKTVCITDLALNSSTDVETALAWSKRRGIIVGTEDMRIEIDVLPTKDHAIQISAYAQYAFARRYEEGVVEIYADQSPS